MSQTRPPTRDETTNANAEIARTLETLRDFFHTLDQEPELPQDLRARAATAAQAAAQAARAWPHILQDWSRLRNQIAQLRHELARIERELGTLRRAIEQEYDDGARS
mgnify:CR=1 FL=1